MAFELITGQQLEIELALQALNADFCFFSRPRQKQSISESIYRRRSLYAWKPRITRQTRNSRAIRENVVQQETRTSRHLQSGLRLQIETENAASGQSVCMTFGADQMPPISLTEPLLIADFVDRYERGPDDRWRFSKRHIERIFVCPGKQRSNWREVNSRNHREHS